MLSRAEQALPASGANVYRVAELRSGPPSLRTRHPKHSASASKTNADPAPAPSPAPQPKVAILLCTYQGQHYLEEQLMSFQAQKHANWVLHVSDDGSSDDTRHILRRYQALLGADKMAVKEGPLQGFAFNFMSLVGNPEALADYYAFSDQDDIWEMDKLGRAVAWLQTIAPTVPALYCSRTRIVDEYGVTIGFSPLFQKLPCFPNALVQNIGGGNTMVFNEAARRLIAQTTAYDKVVSHDWWVYILICACGGQVFYDRYPSVRYRQHANNLVGSNNSWRARIYRISMLAQGRFKRWNDSNIKLLQELEHLMTLENREILRSFSLARNESTLNRLILLNRSGVSRQTWSSQLSLFIAAFFGKL